MIIAEHPFPILSSILGQGESAPVILEGGDCSSPSGPEGNCSSPVCVRRFAFDRRLRAVDLRFCELLLLETRGDNQVLGPRLARFGIFFAPFAPDRPATHSHHLPACAISLSTHSKLLPLFHAYIRPRIRCGGEANRFLPLIRWYEYHPLTYQR